MGKFLLLSIVGILFYIKGNSQDSQSSKKKQYQYIDCNYPGFEDSLKAAKKKRDWYKNASCEDWVFTIEDGKFGGGPNLPFNSFDRYTTKDISLLDKSAVNYDSRILGTWHDTHYNLFYTIKRSYDRNSPFKISKFQYDQKTRKYEQLDGDMTLTTNYDISNIYVTNIDSTLFMEIYAGMWANTGRYRQRVPAKYSLVDDDHIVFEPLSQEFTPVETIFSSTKEFRNYVALNKSKEGFFAPKLNLYRYKGETLPVSVYEKAHNEALIGIAVLLMVGAAILEPSNVHDVQPEARRIISYDKSWNPQYEGGVHTGTPYYNANGRRQ